MDLTTQIFPQFDVDGDPTTVAARWAKYVEKFENYLLAMNITDAKRQRALLLHFAGDRIYDVFSTLPDTGDNFVKAVQALEKYFKPTKNIEYSVYQFRKEVQGEDTMDQYATRLRQLAKNCDFHDKDREIKAQIVQGCTSSRLRRKALREPELSLTQLLDAARALEMSEVQAKGIEGASGSVPETEARVNKVKHFNRNKSSGFKSGHSAKPAQKKTCLNCDQAFPHAGGKTSCPAYRKDCNYCKKPNHFAKSCRKKKVDTQNMQKNQAQGNAPKSARSSYQAKAVDIKTPVDYSRDDSSSDDEYAFTISLCRHDMSKAEYESRPKVKVQVCESPVIFLLDTGATCNLIDRTTYESLKQAPNLQKSRVQHVTDYGMHKNKIIGKFAACLEGKENYQTHTFHVTDDRNGNILGSIASQALGYVIITTTLSSQEKCEAVKCETTEPDTKCEYSSLLDKFPKLTTGVGKLTDFKLKLHIDKTVKPVIQPHRRVPFHLRKQVGNEINRLLEEDIIERVEGPTIWCSPIVAVQKRDQKSVRICLDMRCPNTAILRERHVTPTVEELVHDMNNCKFWSRIDLNSAYHQIELDEDSRYICTFSSHLGLFRFKRLIFGVSCASEMFQNIISQLLADIDGVRNYSDDVIVYAQLQKQHDERLLAVLQRLQDRGLTVNAEKCQFGKQKLEFMGLSFSEEGVSPTNEKVSAIKEADAPRNVSELRSFLGMLTYSSRFIRDFATLTAPLRELLHKNVTWKWKTNHENAFKTLKDSVSDASLLAYYDNKKHTAIMVDASPVGLSAILLQGENDKDWRHASVVAYASCALTPVQSRYSQTEREALAVVWACEHFRIYLLGSDFKVITDHKPLEYIFNNPTSKPKARMERFCMRLQAYRAQIIYRPGKFNASDYLSRHPSKTTKEPKREHRIAEEYVNFLSSHACPKAMTLKQVKEETVKDAGLVKIMKAVQCDEWTNIQSDVDLHAFYNVRDELTVNGDENLILRKSLLVLPKSLQKWAVELAHGGHQGIFRSKQLLREKVWFPGIDNAVERAVSRCLPCQATTIDRSGKPPVNPSELPPGPWQQVSVDFLGPFRSGHYVLSVIDEHSRFPEVEIVKSTAAATVCEKLEKNIFHPWDPTHCKIGWWSAIQWEGI